MMINEEVCCNIGGQHVQPLDMQRSCADHEDDQCSSYGTDESEEEEALEINQGAGSDDVLKRLDEMKDCMELMQATQKSIATKLAEMEGAIAVKLGKMEKAVVAEQLDTTSTREEMGEVHEVVHKLTEYVCELGKTLTESIRARRQKSPDSAPWGKFTASGPAADSNRVDTTIIAEGDKVHLEDEEPSHVHRAEEVNSEILETQMYETNIGLHANIAGFEDNGDGDGWYDDTEAAISSPSAKQIQSRSTEEVEEDEPQQTEMSLEATQCLPQTAGPGLWETFRNACRDLPSLAEGSADGDGGWVRPKRGRGSNRDARGPNRADALNCGAGTYGNLNLNLSPEGVGGNSDMRGVGEYGGKNDRGGGKRGRPRGSGRGTGRVRRPPTVQPRFQSSVRPCSTVTLRCSALVVFVVKLSVLVCGFVNVRWN